jgi:Tol biopolymer transport system component
MSALGTAIVLLAPQVSGATAVTFPGTNGSILFVSDRAMVREGWEVPPQGGRPQRLRISAQSASWSPDGRRIAFEAQQEIYIVNANGRGLRRVTRNRVQDALPSWSPDGSKILFTSRRSAYVMNPDGTARRPLVRSPLCVWAPKWSPDGRKIAFVDLCGGYALYVMDSDGTRVRPVGAGDNPDWSPDGTQLAVDTGLRPLSIEVLNADGSARRTLTTGAEPAWSPDGQKIVFTREEVGLCTPADRVTRLMSINVDGTDEVEVTQRTSNSSCEFRDSNPDWQPRCTRYGTRRSNLLVGTKGRDLLCPLAGGDNVRALDGNDVVLGGDGKDAIYGGPGSDWLFGSSGDDLILARDGEQDIVNGGPGRDRARIDRGLDTVSNIENVLN